MANKVQFGLKNCYAAVITESAGAITYGTPIPIPGGVNLNLSAEGEVSKFYADNIIYYQSASNNGYSGDLEVAKVPDDVLTGVFGLTLGSTSKVLTENINTEPKRVALLFQIIGDAENELYVIYDCILGRPALASGTIKATKEPVTQTMSISAVARPDGKLMARTTSDTATSTRSGWFSSVFVEGA